MSTTIFRKGICLFMSVLILLFSCCMQATVLSSPADNEAEIDNFSTEGGRISYNDWLTQYKNSPCGQDTVRLNADSYVPVGDKSATVNGGSIVIKEGTSADFSFTIKSSGLYILKIGYAAAPADSMFASPIELSISVNGSVPYKECDKIILSRVYGTKNQGFEQDEFGNDIQPEQYEITQEREYQLWDSTGYHSEGMRIYMNSGENTLTLTGMRDEINIRWIEISPPISALSYEEYKQNMSSLPCDNEQVLPAVIQAEDMYFKSDCAISPTSDRTSASVTPNSPQAMRLNTVGGSNFDTVGQWATWKVKVDKSGFYKIALHAKQSVNAGTVSSRKVTIDGKLPFAEAAAVIFPYSRKYDTYILTGNDTELEFYLEEGEHEIGLEVVLGPMSEYIEQVSSSLKHLNNDYLSILFYTGSKPDIYREYGFEKLVPQVIEDFRIQSQALKESSKGIRELSNSRGDITATLDRLSDLLDRMSGDTDEISRNFASFKDNLASLGAWINQYSKQPLQMDTIILTPADQPVTDVKEGFFNNIWFKMRIFLNSFTDDYNSSENKGRSIQVWLSTGQDQSRIISRLSKIDAAQTGLNANVRLVSADALLPNILADSPIDVYLNAAPADPMNFAIREAVIDLKQFEDFEEVAKRFHPAAFEPFSYRGAVYALPESLDFPLLFYRTDIFEDLGLTVPKTWDDFYETVAVLQKNNLTAGVTWTDIFNIMLYQSGGSYYNKDKTASMLANATALDVFSKITRLYTDYGLPVEFSFPNRFRSGDMPMGIVPYTMYNQLYLFAPEISGLWAFAEVPGTLDENGEIHNMLIASGTGAIIPRSTSDKQVAWEFLKWWTQADVQIDFGIEMEKVMGPAARQSNANLDVVRAYPWTDEEFSVIAGQWEKLNAIPQIPGSYYTQRTLDFAFSSVYSLRQDPARTIQDNVRQLNSEIDRKMAELYPQLSKKD